MFQRVIHNEGFSLDGPPDRHRICIGATKSEFQRIHIFPYTLEFLQVYANGFCVEYIALTIPHQPIFPPHIVHDFTSFSRVLPHPWGTGLRCQCGFEQGHCQSFLHHHAAADETAKSYPEVNKHSFSFTDIHSRDLASRFTLSSMMLTGHRARRDSFTILALMFSRREAVGWHGPKHN